MTPAAALKQIQELITLATNEGANIDEARNAALKACRLIRLHGLRVVEAMAVAAGEEIGRQTRARTPRVQKDPKTQKPFSEIMADAAVRGGARFARDVTREAVPAVLSSLFGGRR